MGKDTRGSSALTGADAGLAWGFCAHTQCQEAASLGSRMGRSAQASVCMARFQNNDLPTCLIVPLGMGTMFIKLENVVNIFVFILLI